MSRTALCLLMLCAFASTGVAAREVALMGPGSGGGNSTQCADEEIEAAVVEATQKSSAPKPRGPVAQQPRKPAKAAPAARTESSRVAAPRWHSFLPGMFR